MSREQTRSKMDNERQELELDIYEHVERLSEQQARLLLLLLETIAEDNDDPLENAVGSAEVETIALRMQLAEAQDTIEAQNKEREYWVFRTKKAEAQVARVRAHLSAQAYPAGAYYKLFDD